MGTHGYGFASVLLVVGSLLLVGCTDLKGNADAGDDDAGSGDVRDGGGEMDAQVAPPDDGGGCFAGTFGTSTFGAACFGE